MKINYKEQLMISFPIIILGNVLNTMLGNWIYRSAGFVICGLLWVIHPVLPNGAEVSKRTLLWTRIAGMILIFIGVLTRVYS